MAKIKTILSTCVALAIACGAVTYKVAGEGHHVSYDFNGGTAVSEDYATEVTYVEEEKVADATKEHYVLSGYSDEEGNVWTVLKHVAKDLNLTAIWSPEVYDITFYDGETEVSKSNYSYGTEVDLSVFAQATIKNHPYEDFQGWSIDEEVKTKLSADDFGDKVATAKFEGKTYNITFENDGGSSENPTTYKYGEGLELQDAVKDGYAFDGWYSDESHTQKVESIGSEEHDDKTLYAGFTKVETTSTSTGSSNSSSRRSSGSSQSSSSSSSSSSGSWDTSVGVTIPRLGYHVDNVVVDGDQSDVDAANTGILQYTATYSNIFKPDGSIASTDEMLNAENATGLSYPSSWEALKAQGWYSVVHESTLVYNDHAYQGLSGAGWRLQAGDVCYINGTAYTYSGVYDVNNSIDFVSMPSGTRLIIGTCTEDNTAEYWCYFY